MSAQNLNPVKNIDAYTSMNRMQHTLHECRDASAFTAAFESITGRSVSQVVDDVISSSAPKAVFAVGSLALGMGTSGSDVDLIALIDSKAALVKGDERHANMPTQLEFANQSDPLLAGIFLSVNAGLVVDLSVVITPAVSDVYRRLRQRGPELGPSEIRILGRLNTGWLLWQSPDYLASNPGIIGDPSLSIYCCTKNYVSALHEHSKAQRALGAQDVVQALYLGRLCVEMAYLAYFSSENLNYLGSRWLAQVGQVRDAESRLARHPILQAGIPLLFPAHTMNAVATAEYLKDVARFVTELRQVVERKTLFRIALSACPQVVVL